MADRTCPEPWASPEAEALRDEMAAELGERYGRDSEPGEKPSAEDVVVHLVVRAADRAVGCGALRDLGGGAAEIKRMYLRPVVRGSGLARRLLEALEAEARARGFSTCRLETGERQPEAIAVLRKAGYTEVPCFEPYAGMPLSRCFEKPLGPGAA